MEILQEQQCSSPDLWEIANDFAVGNFRKTNRIMEDLGSPRPHIKWSPSPAELPTIHLQKALEWWESSCGDDLIPSPEAVKPAELSFILGRIALLDVIENGEDFKYRLYGSNILPEKGKDLTGMLLSEIWTPLKAFFIINCRAITLTKMPLFTVHVPHHTLNLSKWERLLLPLGYEGQVTRIMTVLIPTLPDPIGDL